MSRSLPWQVLLALGVALGSALALLPGCVTVEGEAGSRDLYEGLSGSARNDLRQARVALEAGQLVAARAAAQRVIAGTPGAEGLLEGTAALTPASPAVSMAYVLLAASWIADRDDRLAEQCLGAALRADLRNAVARYNLGNIYGRLKRHGDAAAQFREAVRLDPGYRAAWLNLATAEANRRRSDQARAAVRRLLKLSPRSADAYNVQGTIELDEGMALEAIGQFKRAAALDPLRPDFQLNLARAYELTERKLDAARAYQRFLELAPATDKDREAARQALVRLGSGS